MELWTKDELLLALKSQIIEAKLSKLKPVKNIVIDNRQVQKNSVFIALKGDNNDGHNYLSSAFDNGACLAIIESESLFKKYKKNFNLILVKNTFTSLYKLAIYSRKRTKAKVIAVTGSVGKTSVKEMLKLVFSSQGKTYANYGNLNNHIGLPLSLANLPEDFEYAIFEMGMNHQNEIAILSKLTKPDIAIITNVASAHIGNFKNEKQIALAKSEIFLGLKKNGLAILNIDNRYCNFLTEQALLAKIKPKNIVTFGLKSKSDYRLLNFVINGLNCSSIVVATKNHSRLTFNISSINKSVIHNSLIAVALLDLIGKNISSGIQSLKNLETPKARGELIEIKNKEKNITLIDDSYNANIASVTAGIEYLADLKVILNKKRSVAILGDMLELGKDAIKIHTNLARLLKKFKIDQTILVGDLMRNVAKKLGKKDYSFFVSSKDAANKVESLLKNDDIVLVKGSRGMKMENIINELTNKNEQKT